MTLTDQVLEPGVLEVGKKHVLVGTGTHAVRLGDVQAHGKKQMAAADWARGLRLEAGAVFGDMSGRARIDPARLVAFEVLKAVRVEDAYTNLVLPALLRQEALSGRDAAFATELASGTIRWQGTYDAILAACIDRQLSKVESKVLDALRLGTHQLLAMRVPSHAAISTTVDLVRSGSARGPPASPTRCSARSPLRTWLPGSRRSPPTRPRHTATRRGSSTSCVPHSAATTSSRRC